MVTDDENYAYIENRLDFGDNVDRIKNLYFMHALTRNICYRSRQDAKSAIPSVCVTHSGHIHFYLHKDTFIEMSIDGSLSCVSVRNHSITIIGNSDNDFVISNQIANIGGHNSLLMAERHNGYKIVLDQTNKNMSVGPNAAYNIDESGEPVRVKESNMFFECLLRDIFNGRNASPEHMSFLRDLVRTSRFVAVNKNLIRIQIGIVDVYQNVDTGRVFVELRQRYQITVDPCTTFVRLSTVHAFVQIDHNGNSVRAKSDNGKLLMKDDIIAVRALEFLATLDVSSKRIRIERFNLKQSQDDTFSFKPSNEAPVYVTSENTNKNVLTCHQVLYVPPGIRQKIQNQHKPNVVEDAKYEDVEINQSRPELNKTEKVSIKIPKYQQMDLLNKPTNPQQQQLRGGRVKKLIELFEKKSRVI